MELKWHNYVEMGAKVIPLHRDCSLTQKLPIMGSAAEPGAAWSERIMMAIWGLHLGSMM